MKKLIYTLFIAAAMIAGFTSCEKMQNFQTVIDAPTNLVFASVCGQEAAASTMVVHTPIGSIGNYQTVFPIFSNLEEHPAGKVTVEYSSEAASAFPGKLPVLPESYLRIVKNDASDTSTEASRSVVINFPANLRMTPDSVKIALVGNLEALTEKEYIAAVRISSTDLSVSEVLNTYYLKVSTTHNNIKPITTLDEIDGTDCADKKSFVLSSPQGSLTNPANALDGSTRTYMYLPNASASEVVIDLNGKRNVSGFGAGMRYNSYGYVSMLSCEYSNDGVNFESFGETTNESAYYYSNQRHWALYGPMECSHIKMTFSTPYSSYGTSYRSIFQIYVYTKE